MAFYGIICNPMELNAILWDSIESYWIQWNPTEFNGTLYSPKAIQWNPVEFNSIQRNSIECYGILWGAMGFNGIP